MHRLQDEACLWGVMKISAVPTAVPTAVPAAGSTAGPTAVPTAGSQ